MVMNKTFLFLIATCLILTLGNFYLHVAPFSNTMIHYADENSPNTQGLYVTDGFTNWAVDYHKTLPDFKKRPVTTLLVESVSKFFDLRIGLAFVWVNYLFLFLSGFLVYYLALLYSDSHRHSIISVAFFYTCFSILLAYFIPIATYDEPVQYFFILLSLIAIKKRFFVLFILSFSLAIITRENTLLMLPAIFFFLTGFQFKNILRDKIFTLKMILICVIPVLIYALYLIWFYTENPEIISETTSSLDQKFSHYKKNFRDVKNSSRTILSFISVFLFPLFLIIYGRLKYRSDDLQQKLIHSFWLTFAINTPIIFVSVYAEESRVFALPVLFILPVAGQMIAQSISFSREFIHYFLNLKQLLIFIITGIAAWFLFDQGYRLTQLHMNENLYRQYNVAACLFICLILIYRKYKKKLSY